MQFSLQIFILSMAENFLHPYLDDTYLLSMYVCMYMYMYIISHCSLWHSVFLILRISMLWMMFSFFCMFLQNSCECILFQCQVVYIYQVSCIYRHILLLQLPFYRSEMRLYILWPDISQIWTRTGCEEIFTYLRELLCMWPAIFLIDPDALIIPRTWYVLNECLKVCHN